MFSNPTLLADLGYYWMRCSIQHNIDWIVVSLFKSDENGMDHTLLIRAFGKDIPTACDRAIAFVKCLNQINQHRAAIAISNAQTAAMIESSQIQMLNRRELQTEDNTTQDEESQR